MLDNDMLDNSEDTNQYLLFKLGEEVYGVRLLHIKNIIKPTKTKAIPHSKPHFKGVIDLRGDMISIIDLRIFLNIDYDKKLNGLILVIDIDGRSVGAVVDDVISVCKIETSQISVKSDSKKNKDEFFYGVAKHENGLVNLIDIKMCISGEELKLSNAESSNS